MKFRGSKSKPSKRYLADIWKINVARENLVKIGSLSERKELKPENG